MTKPQTYDGAFARLVACAVAGERCPTNDQMAPSAFSHLARQGRIRIRVFRLNYRVVDILVGEHAGKSTMDAPDRRRGEKPYKIIDADTAPPIANDPRAGANPPVHIRAPWKPGDPRP